MPKKTAANLRQRQNARDFAPALGDAVMRAMVKYIFDDLLPAYAVKKTRPVASVHERVPTLVVRAFESANNDIAGRREIALRIYYAALNHAAAPRNTRSTRSQQKSASRRRILGSVRLRLR